MLGKLTKILIVGFLNVALISCANFPDREELIEQSSLDIVKVQADIRDNALPETLSYSQHPELAPGTKQYLDFYSLPYAGIQYHQSYLKLQGKKIHVQMFVPENPRGTIVYLHGYLDHSATNWYFIRESLAKNYALVTYDLPGHGLSGGSRAEIGEFHDNALVLNQLVEQLTPLMPKPMSLIGHSTGGAIIFEYLQTQTAHPFSEIVLLAPLVHHKFWKMSKVTLSMADIFVDKVKRRARKNTSNDEYEEFLAQDPLQQTEVPFNFLRALFRWEEGIHDYPKVKANALIIQGESDRVVDWDYNIRFLSEKIVCAKAQYIPKAQHQLANERKDMRDKIFTDVFTYLNEEKRCPT